MLDLIAKGSSWDEIVILAKAIEDAGATNLNTGIGWNEARKPTIATMVPAGAFSKVTKHLKPEISIPIITSNRINTPELTNQLLEDGVADMVSMARPFLADAQFAEKAKRGEGKAINVCIACNQACIDRVFVNKNASCMVNPRAGNETQLIYEVVKNQKRVAVVGGGPAGLTFSAIAAERGHHITLFEKGDKLGWQFNLAKRIPEKEEFQHTINYFTNHLEVFEVDVRLLTTANAESLKSYDEIVLATGDEPRNPEIEGIHHKKVMTYIDAIYGKKEVGKRVFIIGAGGIGFDVAELLTHDITTHNEFYDEWGIDMSGSYRGGLKKPEIAPSSREVFLVQRKKEKMGKRLGKTTGWIHRLSLKHKNVHMWSGVSYVRIDDAGLHLMVDEKPKLLAVDSVIICTGQVELRSLFEPLKQAGKNVH